MVRALTDQKFEQPYEWPARGKDYRNDLLELRITDYKYLPWDTKTTVSMVKTMIIRWLLYRGLKDEAKDIYNTIKWWDVFITRGEILDMITNNLLIHLGFVESTDKGITWKLRISATRINALNIGNIEKEQILWPINDKKVHKAAPKINVYKFDSTLVRLSQEKLKNLKLYDWPIDWIANEELQTAVDIYMENLSITAPSIILVNLNKFTDKQIMTLQQKLFNLRFYFGNIDGKITPELQQAVDTYMKTLTRK